MFCYGRCHASEGLFLSFNRAEAQPQVRPRGPRGPVGGGPYCPGEARSPAEGGEAVGVGSGGGRHELL